ncbi:MAG TPA: hypothetical protein VGE59_04775 [Patescibacteria group bacterium]
MVKKLFYSLLGVSLILFIFGGFYLWQYFSHVRADYDLLSRDRGSELIGWGMVLLIIAYGVLIGMFYHHREKAYKWWLILLSPFMFYSVITLGMLLFR